VAAQGLVKRYGDLTAVDGIDVAVAPGECFGFLGPNGAGKSSTMRMLSCLAPRDGGDLRVLGIDPDERPRELKRMLGVVAQETTLDLELSVRENLLVFARYFAIPRDEAARRADELLGLMALGDRRDDPVDRLSGGMRRRLQIARALINRPRLVLLDEPTTGLDPQARHAVWERLRLLRSGGATLVLTTHYMDEAEQLCDRLVVMDRGRIVAEGSPQALIERYVPREVVELRFPSGTPDALGGIEGAAARVEVLADRVLLYTDDARSTAAAVAGSALAVAQTLTRRSSLEDVFLMLSGRSLNE
jgi:lipooligosaccharide transport system ATP-binding protein